jgi:FtsP/CotA-like multicopper oxidase with cupredoxin domain
MLKKLFSLVLSSVVLGPATTSFAKVVRYELNATKGKVNLSGKSEVDWALMINGSIPAPTLEFTEGDEAEIVVHNKLAEEVSIHWHGILLPPEMDGVAYVNTPPIHAGESLTFRFKIRQHGTYWYHSHTRLQEQKGIYGGIIIHPREKKIAYDRDVVVVLSDWSDEDADHIMKNLRKDGDYYLYKKNSMRSWLGAVQAGALGTYVHNEWTRMGGMDLSDVGYDAFLANGKRSSQLVEGRPGDKVRIRIINAAASSYFYVSLGNEPMNVISADGIDVVPTLAKELLIGMAETYDVLFEIPKGNNTELRATCQDVTGYASAWIGSGEKIAAPDKAMPDMYAAMDHGSMGHGDMDHSTMNHGEMDHSKMDHSKMDHASMGHAMDHGPKAVESLTVDDLKSPVATAFSKSKPIYDLKLVLGGDMERYVWHVNGKAIHQDRTIEINEGDVVRFTFVNDTMMHHPMHLHGHFFRVVNEHGDFSPLKHTVDVPPHGSRTIEFYANEPGQWMLHCHNLYHMKTGMARVIKYKSFTPSPEMAKHEKHDPHLHDHIYFNGAIEAATNHAKAEFRLSKTWDTLELHAETSEYDSADHLAGDLFYRRWFTNFFNVVVGGTYYSEFEEHKTRGVIGVGYTLPLLIETNLLVDHKAKLRLDVEKRFQWTSTVFSEFEASFRQEFTPEFGFSLMYGPSWSWAVGLRIHEEKLGVGLQYKF